MKYPILLIVYLLSLSCDKEDMKKQESNLLGTWELVRYEGISHDTFQTAPENEKPISITFMETTFEGNTNINEFFGDYRVKSESLTLKSFNGTEAGESGGGQKFYNSIRSTYDIDDNIFEIKFIIQGNNLKFEYEPLHFMIFIKR